MEKCLGSSHSLDTWRWSLLRHWKAEAYNIDGKPGTIPRNRYFGVFGDGTRLAMPKTRLRAGLTDIEAWFRGY